jgi:hypothetical protein
VKDELKLPNDERLFWFLMDIARSEGVEADAAAILCRCLGYTPVTLSGHTTPVNEADLAAGVRDVNERMSRTMHTAQEVFAHEDEPQDETTQKPRAYMRRWAYDGKDVMDIPEKDRPQDFGYRQEVTLTQLFPDDVPLYSLEPKP